MRLVQQQQRPDASMSLLVDLMTTGALDEGYAIAAARRAEAPGSPQRRRQVGRAAAVALLVVGALLAVAVDQLRQSRPSQLKARDGLRARIVSEDKDVAGLAKRVDAARAETARLRDAALGGPGTSLEAVEIGAGLLAVQGPGIEVTVNDAPGTSGDPFGADENRATGGGRVLDRDLQRVVNALWASGAEAVSVAGFRLTAASAIRSAGDAVLVDYRPLSPPYVIQAIGDPRSLEANFSDSGAAQSLVTLHSVVGLRFSVRSVKELHLAAASGALSLRYAHPEGLQ
ncbi:MAG: hypothetical protein QOJ92_2305 [Frankiales bacterium]|nr:hypothetical protein [Frankiales bacterium]